MVIDGHLSLPIKALQFGHSERGKSRKTSVDALLQLDGEEANTDHYNVPRYSMHHTTSRALTSGKFRWLPKVGQCTTWFSFLSNWHSFVGAIAKRPNEAYRTRNRRHTSCPFPIYDSRLATNQGSLPHRNKRTRPRKSHKMRNEPGYKRTGTIE